MSLAGGIAVAAAMAMARSEERGAAQAPGAERLTTRVGVGVGAVRGRAVRLERELALRCVVGSFTPFTLQRCARGGLGLLADSVWAERDAAAGSLDRTSGRAHSSSSGSNKSNKSNNSGRGCLRMVCLRASRGWGLGVSLLGP
ncbi:hypothetical protein PLESTF_001635900 [Pleodorina starrii]|nr:hypothetical protein PLESTM_000634000 [Pleodorina starrii]GLC75430.1 hypothetical protein PLESTF_001635900 [Pleodorina starrii]